MKRFSVRRFIYGISQFAIVAMPAEACACLPRSDVEIIAIADAVFTARVVAIRGGAWGFGSLRAKLAVSTATKERIGRHIVVAAAGNFAACGVACMLGRTFRAAATKSPQGLAPNLCAALTSK